MYQNNGLTVTVPITRSYLMMYDRTIFVQKIIFLIISRTIV
jgi:hypothetical protein